MKKVSSNEFEMNKNEAGILNNAIVVCLLAFVCCFLWGSAFPSIKIGYDWFGLTNAIWPSVMVFAGMRFTLAGVLVLLFGSLLAKKPLVPTGIGCVGRVSALCMFQTVLQYVFFYIGLQHTTGVKASIIEGTNVFVCIVVAALIFRLEEITARKLIGCVLGFAGVVLVNLGGSGFDFSLSLFGEGYIFISTFAYAISSVLLKHFSKKDDTTLLSGWQFFFGGIIMMLLGAMFGGSVSLEHVAVKGYVMLLYLAFISAMAYTLWGILLKHNDVSKVAVYGFMNPVIGVILSAILLPEQGDLGVKCIVALMLICAGIYVVNKKPIKNVTNLD